MAIDKLKTKFITGAFINDVKHYFSKINEIIDWINNIGTPSYKVYTALLSQSGQNAPAEIILQNTLGGNVIYEFTSDGIYSIELGDLYITDKVGIFISPTGNSNNYNVSSSISIQYNGSTGYVLRTFDNTGALSNKGLGKTMIEIRIYK